MAQHKSLPPDALYRTCDPAQFAFKTTAELEDLRSILGQDRAVEAVYLGAKLDLQGYNLFVLGPPGTGRHGFIRQFLEQKAGEKPVPSDWCYVNNFEQPQKPKALKLSPGYGRKLRTDIKHFIEEAYTAIPAAFESEDYRTRRQSIEEELKEQQDKVLEEVQQHAQEHGIGIIQTPTGFVFAPLQEGEPISPEAFNKLPEEEQKRLQQQSEELSKEFRKVMQAVPQMVRRAREKVRNLDREVAMFAVGSLIDNLIQAYEPFPKVVEHLKSLQSDIVENIDLFRHPPEERRQPQIGLSLPRLPSQQLQDSPALRRYGVNLLVDRSGDKGAPVVFEDHPSYPYLIGQIEHISQMGTLVTDFNLIKAGALHCANGGYLVLDAHKVLLQPFAWEGLKQALKAQRIRIQSLGEIYGLISTVSLEPEPIPLDVKVVLIGERQLYYLLQYFDSEFSDLFKVAADFEDQMDRSDENVHKMAQLFGTLARREKLKPLDRSGVARIIEESARHAGETKKLSAQIRHTADIVREAHFWASEQANEAIGAAEIQRAIDSRARRASRIRDRLQEEILKGTLLIDTEGEKIGRINGLAVLQVGDFMFANPHRISARLSLGPGKVIDIEREVELSGPIHSKGVLILSGYLASQYVIDRPLSLSATLVFEQSYSGVEGDSASSAELCALLSALAETPLKQSLAITGSINQHGQIQAIGGVNEKIEGFFDICHSRGLRGDQGVVIPYSNVQHLMLRQRVIDAVKAGQFHIYPVHTIDQCMELLTGIEAGERDDQGEFPEGTINQRIKARLIDFAEKRRSFSQEAEEKH